MLPGNRWSAGGVRKAVVELLRVHRRDRRGVERPDPALQLQRPGERLLDGHLLVEREADQERERVGRDEGVGLAGRR